MIERYDIPAISACFSLQARYEAFLKVELAATKAFSDHGVVPLSDYEAIQAKAKVNVDRINELETLTKHDVIAFTRSIDENLGPEKRWFHYGLTSTDVVDTAESLIYRKATDILLQDIDGLLAVLKAKALAYKDLPCIGRTHGMHADITSFGLKFLRFYVEIQRAKERVVRTANALCVCKIEGAVGNFAFVPPYVETAMAKTLGLPTPLIATQVLPRDLHSDYLNALALLASGVENTALEFRNLQRSEIGETSEYFTPGQKGSSAMPHKHNPISFENVSGLARLIRSYAIGAYDNIFLYHERDISHSSYERIAFPDAIGLSDYIVRRLAKTIDKLMVDKAKIHDDIWLTKGVVFSQRVLTELVEAGVSREEAYDRVQKLAFDVYEGRFKGNFIEAVKADSFIASKLSKDRLDGLDDPSFYLRNVDYIYHRVLED